MAPLRVFLTGVFSFLTLAPGRALGAIELRGSPSYLKSAVLDSASTEITLYAGRTGRDCTNNNASFTNPGSTCNSCAKDAVTPVGLQPCNSNEIHAALPFDITLRSDSADDYPASCSQLIVGRAIGGATGTGFIAAVSVTTYQAGVAGQDVTASFRWADICAAAGSASCSQSFSTRFEFSFDPDCNQTEISPDGPRFTIKYRFVNVSPAMSLGCPVNGTGPFEGICNYSIFPGDGKVFIKNPEGVIANEFKVPDLQSTALDTADASGMKYTHLRIYYREGSIAAGSAGQITQADKFKDLAIAGTKLQDERVTDLVNNTPYVFLGAMVDEAGNVTHFAQPNALQAGVHEGTPQEVFGLLDEKGCFIATAAYGSPQAGEIQTLRNFRDVLLSKTEFGRFLIRTYYKYSPAMAAVIREHDVLRATVRGILAPIIWTSEKVLEWGYGFKAPAETADSESRPALKTDGSEK